MIRVICIGLVCLGAGVAAKSSLPNGLTISAYAWDPKEMCTDVKTECENCQTLKVCSQMGTMRINCTVSCDKNTNACSNEPCTGPVTNSEVTCIEDNAYYPSITNCRRFYICVAGIPQMLSCPANSVYSHAKKSCVRQTPQTPCGSVNCNGSSGRYVAYPSDPSFFTMCAGNDPVGLNACEDGQSFDTITGQCGDICREEGNIPNTRDPKKYYMCILVGTNLVRYESECPGVSTYDKQRKMCFSDAPRTTTTQNPLTTTTALPR